MKTLTLLVIWILITGLDIRNSHQGERCLDDEYLVITPSFSNHNKLNSVEILWNAFNDYMETELEELLEYIRTSLKIFLCPSLWEKGRDEANQKSGF